MAQRSWSNGVLRKTISMKMGRCSCNCTAVFPASLVLGKATNTHTTRERDREKKCHNNNKYYCTTTRKKCLTSRKDHRCILANGHLLLAISPPLSLIRPSIRTDNTHFLCECVNIFSQCMYLCVIVYLSRLLLIPVNKVNTKIVSIARFRFHFIVFCLLLPLFYSLHSQ